MLLNTIHDWIFPFSNISDFFVAINVINKLKLQAINYKFIHMVLNKILKSKHNFDDMTHFLNKIKLAPEMYPIGMF